MRVLCIGLDNRIVTEPAVGHAATWSIEIGKRLEQYTVIVEAPAGRDREEVRLAGNVTVHMLAGNRASFPWRAAKLAKRLHAESKFHLCTVEDPFRAGYAGFLFKRAMGIALNVENHTLMIDNPQWLRTRWINRIYNLAGKQVLRHANSIRNRTDDQLPNLLKIGVSRESVFTIPQPVRCFLPASPPALRQKLGIAENSLVFMAAGRMVPVKNLSCILEAFSQFEDRTAQLVVCGDGPSRIGWENRAKELKIADRVHWMGQMSESAMLDMYGICDIFLASSLHETGPRTVLEALAAGKPVIGSPDMGVVSSGILVSNETGLIVKSNPAAFASAMRALASSPQLRQTMGAAGRKKVYETRSYVRIVDLVYASWQKTLDCHERAHNGHAS